MNGEQELPLYGFLKKEKGFAGFNPEHPLTVMMESMLERTHTNFRNEPEIKWNIVTKHKIHVLRKLGWI